MNANNQYIKPAIEIIQLEVTDALMEVSIEIDGNTSNVGRAKKRDFWDDNEED